MWSQSKHPWNVKINQGWQLIWAIYQRNAALWNKRGRNYNYRVDVYLLDMCNLWLELLTPPLSCVMNRRRAYLKYQEDSMQPKVLLIRRSRCFFGAVRIRDESRPLVAHIYYLPVILWQGNYPIWGDEPGYIWLIIESTKWPARLSNTCQKK